jgi:hypothetical protein
MPKKRNDALMENLALHVAVGGRVATWAKGHNVSERCARGWCALPEFKALVRQHRMTIVDRVLGRTVELAEKAMEKLGHLMENAKQEATQARAAEFISTHLMTISSFAEFERRLSELEQAQSANPSGAGNTTDQA